MPAEMPYLPDPVERDGAKARAVSSHRGSFCHRLLERVSLVLDGFQSLSPVPSEAPHRAFRGNAEQIRDEVYVG